MIELLNCDCMEYMKTCEDNAFDLAIVDPPYGINAAKKPIQAGKWKRDIHSSKDWDSKPPSPAYFNELFRVSKNQIIWGGNYFLGNLPATPCFIVWDKKLENGWLADCELAWASFSTQVKKFTRHHIDDHNEGRTYKIHPTQKPVALMEYLIKTYTNEGETVLDFTMGSGTTGVACKNTNRHFIGIEKEIKYYDIAIGRIEI